VVKESTQRTLEAGPWSAVLSPHGALSRLSWGGVEILRGLSVVVRTNTWLTVPPEATVAATTTESGFRVEITARNRGPQVDFAWTGVIEATAEGDFRFALEGVSQGVSSTNRIGLIALHSLNWAGRPCVVTHTDGSIESTAYPDLVSPHQPMMDLGSITQALAPGRELTISFAGEVFEMEDQRNWTDASYKTYSRPLAWPFPYKLANGEVVRQDIVLSVSGQAAGSATTSGAESGARTPEPTVVSLTDESRVFPWPRLGLGTDPTSNQAIPAELAGRLRPTHLRVDLVAEAGVLRGGDVLRGAAGAGVPIELAIHVGVDPGPGLEELAAALEGVVVSAVMVYDTEAVSTTPRALEAVRQALGRLLGAGIPVFVGTDDYFTELNRNRVVPAELGADGVCFSPNPQIHDSGEAAIIETAEAIPAVINTARHIGQGAPIAVSPLVFAPRRNIHAPGRVIDRLGRDDESVDPRWGGVFSAVWLATTLAPLVEGGVERITLAEITGPRGIVDPDGYPPGGSDVEALWMWLCEPRTEVMVAETGDASLVVFADRDAASGGVLLANGSARPRRVRLEGDHHTRTVEIPAYSFLRLDTP